MLCNTMPLHLLCWTSSINGSLLLSAGAKDKRFAMPHSRIMIHQPLGGAQGQCSDIQIQAKEIQDLKQQLNQIYIDHAAKA